MLAHRDRLRMVLLGAAVGSIRGPDRNLRQDRSAGRGLRSRDPGAHLRPQTLLFLVLSGLATGASWVCYFRALKLGQASKVAPIDKLSVVLVALFAVLFLGERPSLRDWCGIALVAAGAIVLGLKT